MTPDHDDPTPATQSPHFIEVDPEDDGPPPRPLEVTLLIVASAAASVVTLIYGASVLFVGGFACCFCFAPLATAQLILGIVGLVYTGRQLSPYPPPFPAGLAAAFILSIVTCDVISPVLGIIMLVLAQTDAARVYYARAGLAKIAAGAGESREP